MFILITGIAIRIALFATVDWSNRPELSTPLTKFTYQLSPILSAAFYILTDLITTYALVQISKHNKANPNLSSAAYLLNPYAIATCVARSTTCFHNALLMTAISRAVNDHIDAPLYLALVTRSAFYPILLAVPLLSLLSNPVLGLAMPLALASWRTILTVPDLTPNAGMWWYFFTEMFDHFRPFFLGVFQLHNFIYLIPICLRLEDNLTRILILLGISSTWKSYPQLGDYALWIALLSCSPKIIANLRHPLFTFSVHLYTTILLPLLHALWLFSGTGNANFFYAASMVYGLNASLAVVDVLNAAIKSGIVQEGWDVVQLTSL